MANDSVIAPEAAKDIDDAYGWYEGQRPGLGEEFLGCVDAVIQAIGRMPELYSKVHKEYRRALVRRFPYAIFYEHIAETVMVYCVFHTSRNPQRWRRRLP
ncbi:type II toxin-antitoxin system RelE/ParE family toxin [uncultured Thiodictyon sp.]|uniref:type II toxin-antitoxin system RelE/ParE family toxin n=1 Tax=uncultured Thiodictyon sp. TaxID=1846217 RepID=UPI0025CD9880|nr:type II toxin-antitoxin system RelE/ParE family toxin [uncultured Thiodictyon sp.]